MAHVHVYTCTQPLHGRVHVRERAVSARVHGRVRIVYTARVHDTGTLAV